MKLYSSNENYKLYQGNMLDMLEVIQPNSIDSIITDPPYELNFMSKGWDNEGISFQKETWKKCYDVLKDGGYLLAFGGSRTFHRIACAIEDAGFEIRDTIMWLYGSGFPKSLNIGLAVDKKNGIDNRTGNIVQGMASNNTESLNNHKYETQNFKKEYEERKAQNEWRGWGTALKPSFEPIIIARKPFKGSLVDNVIKNGVGGINIDECRVEPTGEDIGRNNINAKNSPLNSKDGWNNNSMVGIDTTGRFEGRFPANTMLTYDESDFDEVCGGFPYTKTGDRKKGTPIKQLGVVNEKNCEYLGNKDYFGDSGSASRYFYCAKASKRDRDEGLDNQQEQKVNDGRQTPIDNAFQRGETLRRNVHPTVKPTLLMQYLVRLVTPNNGIILDPFNGSGSTGKAVMYENKERNKNYKYIGIELTEEYLPISKARIEYVCNLIEKEKKEDKQISIFDELES